MKKFLSMFICMTIILTLSACERNKAPFPAAPSATIEKGYSIATQQPVDESSSTADEEPVVSWETNPSRTEIGETNATLALNATISGPSTMKITNCGIELYDEQGNLLASTSESVDLSDDGNILVILCDVNDDLHYTLTSNTKYIFTMFVVIDDAAYTSERYSFTTRDVEPQSQSEDNTNVETSTPTQMYSTPEPAVSHPSLLNGMEQNGQYNLTLYESGIQEVSDGTIVLADLMVPSTITDEEAQNILATDPEASYYNGGSYEEIRYSGGFLIRSAGESLWKKSSPSDVIELEVFSSGEVFIPYNAQFTDNMTSIMLGSIRNVSSLDELFHVSFMGMEFNYSSIEVQVTVSDGVITVVDMYYTP